jgi:cysteine synthase B
MMTETTYSKERVEVAADFLNLPKMALPGDGDAEIPDLIRAIGNTPLLRLNRIGRDLPDSVILYAKAEHLNPTGSVKDRAAGSMIVEGLRSGALRPGKVLIDATSGNTGIAYAVIGALLGVPVTLAMPAYASKERTEILRAHGAELILTDPLEGTDGSQEYVRDLVRQQPEHYFYPDQYNNDANWRAHFDGTGVEILRQTEGRITHFVTGLGTTGTYTGVARRLKGFEPRIRCFAVEPSSPLHGIEGLKHLESAIVPGIYDASLADATLRTSTEEAFEMTRRLAREEGLLVGVSSGANVSAALKVASELEEGVVVTVLADTGMRYLRDAFWTKA